MLLFGWHVIVLAIFHSVARAHTHTQTHAPASQPAIVHNFNNDLSISFTSKLLTHVFCFCDFGYGLTTITQQIVQWRRMHSAVTWVSIWRHETTSNRVFFRNAHNGLATRFSLKYYMVSAAFLVWIAYFSTARNGTAEDSKHERHQCEHTHTKTETIAEWNDKRADERVASILVE